ncbi:MAG TPA: Rne/Rng family ribonuclease [bacterium]|nr:Rne/Rng family ribonuclease [bacterium]
MAKEIIANVEPFEVRVAVVEDGVVVGILIERGEPLAGNIYKGRVASVLPGMEAAFVDVGLDRNAFLHLSDIRTRRITAFGATEEIEDHIGRGAAIAERVRVGQEILVQVTKEPRGSKGARATTYVALPGHYLVLTPTVPGIGVSRKIGDEQERRRLRAIADRLRPEGMGLIVRTAAEGVAEKDLADDVRFLLQLWGGVAGRARDARAPALLYQDLGLIRRVVRDLFTGEVQRFVLDSPDEWRRVRELIGTFSPALAGRVQLHEGPAPIFEGHHVEREIERALHRKVWLKSGGYLVFDRTEAATVIDVNTGKYVGKTDLASTILKTNIEAAREIARQIRLRDIGGIILIDFIDMESLQHRRAVLDALGDAVRADRTKIHIIDLTGLGLVEMTRKRVYQDLEELMRIPCPYCEGRGRVLSPRSVAVRARRELRRLAQTARAACVVAEVHPDVAVLLEEDPAWRRALEQATGKRVLVLPRPGIHLDRAVVRQADTPEAAARQAAQGDGAGEAIWLDPVRGEPLNVPDDETVDARMLRPIEASRPGVLVRLWAWVRGRRPEREPSPPPIEAAPLPLMSPNGPARPRRRGRGRGGRRRRPAEERS